MSVRDDGYILCAYNYDGQGGWSYAEVDTCTLAVGVTLADVDTSGTLDIVGTSSADNTGYIAWWKYSDVNSNWVLGDVIADNLHKPLNTAVADMDGDGDMDVVATINGNWFTEEGALILYTNDNGVGTSWTAQTISSLPHFYDVALDTLNLDGYMDIVATTTDLQELNNEGVFIYYGDANGAYADTLKLYHRTTSTGFLSPRSVKVERMDDNQLNDLLIAFTGDQDNPTSVHHAIFISYATQDGLGGVLWDSTLVDIKPDFTTCRDVEPVDIDFDGDMDFVATSLIANQVDVFYNTANGWDEADIGLCNVAKGVAVDNFDADRELEVLAASYSGNPNPQIGQAVYMYDQSSTEDLETTQYRLTLTADTSLADGNTLYYNYSFTLAEDSEDELYAWYKIVTPDFEVIMQSPVDVLGARAGNYEGSGSVRLDRTLFTDGGLCRFFVSVGRRVYDETTDPPVSMLHGEVTECVKFAIRESQEMASAVETAVSAELPTRYGISRVYPNPFNPVSTFTVALPEASMLNVNVYNISGQLVTTIAEGVFSAGWHEFAFNGRALASGMYFIRASVPGKLNEVRKLTLLR